MSHHLAESSRLISIVGASTWLNWFGMFVTLTAGLGLLHEIALLLDGIRIVIQHLRKALNTNADSLDHLIDEIQMLWADIMDLIEPLRRWWRR